MPSTAVYERRGVLQPGTRVDRYRVDALIAEHAEGDLYLAWHVDLERAVWLRRIRRLNGDRLARFVREARVVSWLDYPGIARVFDFGVRGGGGFYCTEMMSGPTLAERLDAPIEIAEGLTWIRDVAQGLAALHAQGVFHGSITPETITVLDTGRAVLNDPAPGGAPAIGGDYLAPEGRHRFGKATPATDQFALGVVLFETLTGHLPFRGLPGEGSPALPSWWISDIDPALEALVLRSLDREPWRRFPSCQALVDALDEALDGLRPRLGATATSSFPILSRPDVGTSTRLQAV